MTALDPLPSDGADGGPPAGPPRFRWWLVVVPLVAGLLLTAGVLALVVSSDGDSTPHGSAMAAPLELASVSDDVAGHYRFAEAHRAEFEAIPCFCGCEEFLAHENLFDCFVRTDGAGYDSHAAGCGVCIGEAAVAAELLDAGTPVAVVADRIVDQFGTTPVTSPDQTVPRT